MLTKFRVKGFKCFDREIVFDLTRTCSYEFNAEAVKNGVVNKGILYGFNGCGKSNLGRAIFDIVSHLTDKNFSEGPYTPYLCLNEDSERAVFEYQFAFGEQTVTYRYEKITPRVLLKESLWIGEEEMLQYDFRTEQGFVRLKGAETLNLSDSENTISRVKYVRSNAILKDVKANQAFSDFIRFVDNMLLFYSLETNRYLGFKTGRDGVGSTIVRSGKTKEFEKFLRESNVDMELSEAVVDDEPQLMVHYKRRDASFFRVASRGTQSLALFYYWYIVLEKASFVFLDEFDAFYHFELSEHIVELLKQLPNTQVILTTHNTDLLSNDLLRPDCFFWMDQGKITPLSRLTEKELRKAHNLQKMFKAGAFNG